jgi:hypothetical protein
MHENALANVRDRSISSLMEYSTRRAALKFKRLREFTKRPFLGILITCLLNETLENGRSSVVQLSFPTSTRMNNHEPVPRIIQLASTIKSSVATIQKVLDALGAPSPTFDENAPMLPPDIDEAKDVVLDATTELRDLLTDPMNIIHRSARVRLPATR